jgi:hypothetical protein
MSGKADANRVLRPPTVDEVLARAEESGYDRGLTVAEQSTLLHVVRKMVQKPVNPTKPPPKLM